MYLDSKKVLQSLKSGCLILRTTNGFTVLASLTTFHQSSGKYTTALFFLSSIRLKSLSF